MTGQQNDGTPRRDKERVLLILHSSKATPTSSSLCPHLFVGGHDPLDGIGPWGQEVTRRGESLRPLTHPHMRLTIGCFLRTDMEEADRATGGSMWFNKLKTTSMFRKNSFWFTVTERVTSSLCEPVHNTVPHVCQWALQYRGNTFYK